MSEVKLFLGDCLEILPTLEAGSVDAVITDPPYGAEYHYLWGKLAELSARLLKDGGLLLTLTGHHSLDNVLSDMTKYLHFYWIGGMPNSLGTVARYHPRQMMIGWKPCLWLVKGKARPHSYVFDMYQTKRIDRVNHEWEQPLSWFAYYVDKLTSPGDIVLDPFMGSGTTGIACVKTGRNFIGIEIDPTYFEIAKRRIEQAQMQLRLTEPEALPCPTA